MIVLDASVVLKWFLEEDDTEKALMIRWRLLRNLIEISVPDLLLSEVVNVLRYNPNYDSESTKEAVNSIIDLKIDIVIPSVQLYELAIDLAYKYDISVYDALYIALARDLDFELITADKKLFEKVKELTFIKLLSEYLS